MGTRKVRMEYLRAQPNELFLTHYTARLDMHAVIRNKEKKTLLDYTTVSSCPFDTAYYSIYGTITQARLYCRDFLSFSFIGTGTGTVSNDVAEVRRPVR